MSQTTPAPTPTAGTITPQIGRNPLVAARDALIVAANHEFRTPLTVVVAVCELLLDDEAGPLNEEQRALLTTAARNGARLRSLVEELLAGTSDALDVALAPEPEQEQEPRSTCPNAARRGTRLPGGGHSVVVPLRRPAAAVRAVGVRPSAG